MESSSGERVAVGGRGRVEFSTSQEKLLLGPNTVIEPKKCVCGSKPPAGEDGEQHVQV